jgi:hypothetical protein
MAETVKSISIKLTLDVKNCKMNVIKLNLI